MWRGEVRLDTGPKRGISGLEGGQQGGEEVLRVVILSIEGEPDSGHPTLGEQLGQQGGFAEARRGTEQDEALREVCWLLVASVGSVRPLRASPSIARSLPIPQRKSTMASIHWPIFTKGEHLPCMGFSPLSSG